MTIGTAPHPITESTFCPACLTELPPDFPFDHVAIDRALAGQPHLFAAMDRLERREVVLTGLARGLTVTSIAHRLGSTPGRLRGLLPDEHPESAVSVRRRRVTEQLRLDQLVRDLWEQGLPDVDIALRAERSVYVIADVRRRLSLATHTTRRGLFTGGPR